MASAASGLLLGLQAATQFVGWTFAWSPALGPGIDASPDLKLYPPWRILAWRAEFGGEAPRVFAAAGSLVLLGVAGGLGVAVLFEGQSGAPRRTRGWGDRGDAGRAGLFGKAGCVLGEFGGRLLITADLRPTLVTGGTRSGKGRGHVVPSLLCWTESAMIHDPKGELWEVTAGWRARFSHAFRFNPRAPVSARWNPLAEIQPGPAELAQVQRLVAILSDPGGVRDEEAIWDKSASEILEAVILHVLYTAEDAAKSLLKVRELLADLDEAAEAMLRTHHVLGAGGEPETHPFIRTAVKGYLARQLVRFGDVRLALAAYNSGPDRVGRLGRVPRIPETQDYVRRVVDCYLALSAGRAVRTARDCQAAPS